MLPRLPMTSFFPGNVKAQSLVPFFFHSLSCSIRSPKGGKSHLLFTLTLFMWLSLSLSLSLSPSLSLSLFLSLSLSPSLSLYLLLSLSQPPSLSLSPPPLPPSLPPSLPLSLSLSLSLSLYHWLMVLRENHTLFTGSQKHTSGLARECNHGDGVMEWSP